MKCKQKSCKRNPNQSSTSGFCNVCEDVSKEATDNEKKKNVHCKQMLNKVQIDYNEMVKMHDKLSKGENVDPASTSSLILGGIINILIQHGAIEELSGKLKACEEENVTIKARIESLESWNSKQAEEIKDLANKENEVLIKEKDEMKQKLMNIELEVAELRSGTNMQKKQIHERAYSISCKVCEMTFMKNSDLEMHVMEAHESEKKFSCNVCNKAFVLEWRHKKHVAMHTSINVKVCHFFKNSINCPYELIGCMFKHEDNSEMLESENDEEIEHSSGDDSDNVEETNPFNSNKCHLCSKQTDSKDDLYNHMENEHKDYFDGIREAAANFD